MATGTQHSGKQSLLDIVRIPQDDNSIITRPYLKSKPNFGNFYIFFFVDLAATDGIVGRENGQENGYGALAGKASGSTKTMWETIK